MQNLSDEFVIREILSRLPLKQLMTLKCVSKNWYTFIADEPILSSAHLRRGTQWSGESNIILANGRLVDKSITFSVIDDAKRVIGLLDLPPSRLELRFRKLDEIDILGSCEGLILLSHTSFHGGEKFLILCNPSTRETRVLPGIDSEVTLPPSLSSLGFDQTRREHKVVKVIEARDQKKKFGVARVLNFQVLGKSSKTWATLKPFLGYSLMESKHAALLDGVLYFLALRGEGDTRNGRVLSFSFLDEQVSDVIELPGNKAAGDPYCYFDHAFTLTKWEEKSLGLVALKANYPPKVFDFWVMKSDCLSRVFWSILFHLDLSLLQNSSLEFSGGSRNQFIFRRCCKDRVELLVCDPTRKDPKLATLQTASSYSFAYEFVPTLISVHPKPFVENSKNCRRNTYMKH